MLAGKAKTLSSHWASNIDNLATMIDAGLSIEHALATLEHDQREPDTILKLRRRVAAGQSLPDSLYKSGILAEFDLALLAASNKAGKLAQGLSFVAARHRNRIARADRLRAQFWLPQAILIVACVAALFIRVAQGQSLLTAFFQVVIPASLLWLAARLCLKVFTAESAILLSLGWPFKPLRDHSSWFQQAFELQLYHSLIWLLGAGVTPQKALQINEELLPSASFKEAVSSAARDAQAGKSLPEALQKNGLILSKEWRQVWQVGTEAGRWEQVVAHQLKLEMDRFSRQIEATIKWLPRLYYVAVVVLFARYLS